MNTNMVNMTTVSLENSSEETAVVPTILPFHLSLCMGNLASARYFDGSQLTGHEQFGLFVESFSDRGIEIKSLTTAPAGEWA
jgi:hypothetical protein